MPSVDQVNVSFNNLEADFMSDLVVNCDNPLDILTFTQFVEATIAPEMKGYQETAKKAQTTFQERVEKLAEEYLQKDDKGQYVHGADGNPVPQEGKEEDWKNLYTGAQTEFKDALNKAGNAVVVYKVDSELFHRFADMFLRTSVNTFISLQKSPEEVNRAFLMIYLIAKRITDAKTQTKGNSKKS